MAVFDGHGGENCSTYLSEHFEGSFASAYKEGSRISIDDVRIGKHALRKSFREMAKETKDMHSGCTASVAWIPRGGYLVICAVLGDSPIIVGLGKGKHHLSPDHNARSNQKERKAAQKRGAIWDGHYLWDGFRDSGLQMARAFGDCRLRFISHVPQVYHRSIHDFVLVGTDGLFDPSHKNHHAVDDAVTAVRDGFTAKQLVDAAVALPTEDNVTGILWRK